jgi:hypothetical protein
MRPIAFSALFAMLPVLFPSNVNADVSALPADRLEALLQSEFQFQSGHFNQAFSYYRSQSPAQLSAEELLRGSQLATVLGEGAWLATLDGAPALAEAAQVDLIRQRFERALQLDRSDTVIRMTAASTLPVPLLKPMLQAIKRRSMRHWLCMPAERI